MTKLEALTHARHFILMVFFFLCQSNGRMPRMSKAYLNSGFNNYITRSDGLNMQEKLNI